MYFCTILYLIFFNYSNFEVVKNNNLTSYKTDYYSAFSSTDTVQINKQIIQISNLQVTEKKAYIGALLMRKAGLVSSISSKLNLFLEGRKLLEFAISKDKQNAEYRFLRLVIQENCPSILQYYSKIKEDALMIRTSFNAFTTEVKSAITNYSKTSESLKSEDLLKI